jgi:hypothetical protein
MALKIKYGKKSKEPPKEEPKKAAVKKTEPPKKKPLPEMVMVHKWRIKKSRFADVEGTENVRWRIVQHAHKVWERWRSLDEKFKGKKNTALIRADKRCNRGLLWRNMVDHVIDAVIMAALPKSLKAPTSAGLTRFLVNGRSYLYYRKFNAKNVVEYVHFAFEDTFEYRNTYQAFELTTMPFADGAGVSTGVSRKPDETG